jgi:hypothetical protein
MKIVYNSNGTIDFLATRYLFLSRVDRSFFRRNSLQETLEEIKAAIEENEAFMANWNKRLEALKKEREPSE